MNNVQLLTNAQIRAAGIRAGQAKVTDLRSMEVYNIFWGGPPSTHTDFSPFTPADTEIMRRISGGWNWRPRPVVLHIGDFNLATGVHHFPHGSIIGGNPGLPNMSNTRPAGGWPIGGHMCMYFRDSTGGTSGMREAAAEAFALVMALNEGEEGIEMMRYQTVEEIADADMGWAVPTIRRLIALCEHSNVPTGVLQGNNGDGTGLDLSRDMIRMLVLNDRAGLYNRIGV